MSLSIARILVSEDWRAFVLVETNANGATLYRRLTESEAVALHAELTRLLDGKDEVSRLRRRCERQARALKRRGQP